MNGRYVHVSSSWREEKERHIYSLESVCFYEKQTPLQYLHVLLWFFFLSSFCPVVKRVGLYWKAFIATRNILHVLCLGGNKENKRSLVKSSTSKSNLGRPREQHADVWGSSVNLANRLRPPSTLQTLWKSDICLPQDDAVFQRRDVWSGWTTHSQIK